MGTGEKRRCIGHEDKNNRRCYVLNDFYACFECHDFSEARNNLTDRLTSALVEKRGECITVTVDKVLRQLQRTNPNKAARPNRMNPSILEYDAEQLYVLFSVSFSISPSFRVKYRPCGRPLAYCLFQTTRLLCH